MFILQAYTAKTRIECSNNNISVTAHWKMIMENYGLYKKLEGMLRATTLLEATKAENKNWDFSIFNIKN